MIFARFYELKGWLVSQRLVLNPERSFKIPLSLLLGPFDCNCLYQWLPLRGVLSASSTGWRNSRACEPRALLTTWRAYGTNPTGGCAPSWLHSGVSIFSFSPFSTNITFCFPHPVFSSWRILFISDSCMVCCRLSFERKKKWRKKKNNIVWLYMRKHPGFLFDKFFCICYDVSADCVFMFLLYSCCNGWCRERQRERENEREGATKLEKSSGFVFLDAY